MEIYNMFVVQLGKETEEKVLAHSFSNLRDAKEHYINLSGGWGIPKVSASGKKSGCILTCVSGGVRYEIHRGDMDLSPMQGIYRRLKNSVMEVMADLGDHESFEEFTSATSDINDLFDDWEKQYIIGDPDPAINEGMGEE